MKPGKRSTKTRKATPGGRIRLPLPAKRGGPHGGRRPDTGRKAKHRAPPGKEEQRTIEGDRHGDEQR